ncbi:MAG: S9 family peptidase [Gemmataceae bacterium]
MRTLCLLLVTALLARSAAPPAASPGKWTPDDVVNQETAGDWQFAPDGRSVVWVKTSPDADKNEHVSHLFRTDLTTLRQTRLTRGPESCVAPRWSPDGKHLAFLSARAAPKTKPKSRRDDEDKDDPKAQIWLLDPTGGEPWPVTESKRGVARFGWAGDDGLVFTAQEDPTRTEAERKEEKDDAAAVEDDRAEPLTRLFKVEIEGKKVTRLAGPGGRLDQLSVSPDGRRALVSNLGSLRYTYDNKVKPTWHLIDLEAGSSARVFDEGRLNLVHAAWSPDGRTLYAIDRVSSRPALDQAGLLEVVRLDPKTGTHRRVDLGWERGLADIAGSAAGFAALNDGFLTLLADGVRHVPARYSSAGVKKTIDGEHVTEIASADGKAVVYAHSTASSPPRWHAARLDGGRLVEARPIAALNEHLDRLARARTEVVRWKGGDGDEVEGILYYPHGHKPGTRAPLVVQIHGGPAAADYDAWDEHWAYPANLLCQRGAFVLRPNYHGSTGYGRKFLDSIAGGRYCVPEVEDIEKGVDALIGRGLVDAKRLGLQGWSNGGILTNVLITRTTRYRAAVSGAGTVEYVSDWASCEFGEAFDRFYLGKSPFEDAALYARKSPFYRLDAVTTPTLILFGTEDRVVHPQQGWALYRGLQQLGKAPVRFVQYPGEKHGLKKLSARRRNVVESVAWLDRYLFDANPEDDPLKKDSPLAWMMARAKARRAGPAFGVEVKGVLVPETVGFKGMTVGRFEVTRAQYAACAAAGRPRADNLPAGGVTFEQARGYCNWLSEKTGRRYRLPSAKEAEKLYDGPKDGENTLNAWAGYAPNPEDAAALRKKLRGLGEGALLKEVGHGRGQGEGELVFDLGGNVAEWTDDGGKGKLGGGSADAAADDKQGAAGAGPAYRGFRVVLD